MNQQAIEKAVSSADGFLEVHSIFHTIQGEGPFCGTPAIFIRLAGCNLQCPSCDTDYTSKRERIPANIILQRCVNFSTKGLIVITGGEPFRQSIGHLIALLTGFGYYVQVESNGTLPPPPQIVWSKKPQDRKGAYIVCSPKAGRINTLLEREACAFKYVISNDEQNESDGLPTKVLGHSAHPQVARAVFRGRPVYLQPADAHNEEANWLNNQAAVSSCMKHGYILQLQIHKYLDLE
jgi:organic radical activating enzyme